jgi:hypothetical protein
MDSAIVMVQLDLVGTILIWNGQHQSRYLVTLLSAQMQQWKVLQILMLNQTVDRGEDEGLDEEYLPHLLPLHQGNVYVLLKKTKTSCDIRWALRGRHLQVLRILFAGLRGWAKMDFVMQASLKFLGE